MDEQMRELDSLLRDILQQQGCAYSSPPCRAYTPPRTCATCSAPLTPDVLTVQPMASHCHRCRAGGCE